MSRTTRKHLRYDEDTGQMRLNPEGRDDKGRCDCCGNKAQKANNKRNRATIKRQLRNNPSQ